MNWDLTSFDWNQARAFLATVEEGSLSAAAKALNQTQPTLGRQVAALEKHLGVILFERVGRSLVLTPAGAELAEYVSAMNKAAMQVTLTASGQSHAVEGTVRITASDVMSVEFMPRVISQLRASEPLLNIEIVSDNEVRDLQLREADIAIRHLRPEQPELIAKLICEPTANLYATESFLEKRGRPASLEEISHLEFIGLGNNARLIEVMKESDIHLTEQNFQVETQSGVVAWELAKKGMGVIIMADRIAAKHSHMEAVYPRAKPVVFPIWLVAHKELQTSRRIRIVFDLLAELLLEDFGPRGVC